MQSSERWCKLESSWENTNQFFHKVIVNIEAVLLTHTGRINEEAVIHILETTSLIAMCLTQRNARHWITICTRGFWFAWDLFRGRWTHDFVKSYLSLHLLWLTVVSFPPVLTPLLHASSLLLHPPHSQWNDGQNFSLRCLSLVVALNTSAVPKIVFCWLLEFMKRSSDSFLLLCSPSSDADREYGQSRPCSGSTKWKGLPFWKNSIGTKTFDKMAMENAKYYITQVVRVTFQHIGVRSLWIKVSNMK